MPATKKSTIVPILAAIIATGCTTQNTQAPAQVSNYSASELESRYEVLAQRERAIARKEAELQQNSYAVPAVQRQNPASTSQQSDLLPTTGAPGECYARVWVEPTYKDKMERILVKEASSRVEVIPASYRTVVEDVLVSEASSYIETIPATYETLSEDKLVDAGGRTWKVELDKHAAPASQELLDAASSHGINLDQAMPGQCFHEHFLAAQFETKQEQIVSQEAYDVVNVQEAEYRWVEKQVLVSEASTRIEPVPAVYETVIDRVIDVPAHTIWKKGKGPIQKLDAATGEIMCLVEIPSTYKEVSRTVLVSPATTRVIDIPAVYETINVKELAQEAREIRTTVPAEYETVSIRSKIAEPTFVWHEVHDKSMHRSTRTGNRICLTEQPARYETVTRRVVKSPAATKTIEIPAKYKAVPVQKLVTAASQNTIAIPAEYDTISRKEIDKDGFMEWRSILCETNMTHNTITDIQRALQQQGHNPGKIDGVIGEGTIKAVNAFQEANQLPIDKYINMQTIQALGVSI